MNANILLSPPSGWEWILIIAVVLLLFGGKKIPELMKGLGSGIKEFKQGMKDTDDNKKSEPKDQTPKELN
jgi:sec-independent protein translocase protein TatA